MKRAVITGPTGSIGIALINELVANGIEVLAVVRPGSMRADRIKESSLVKRVSCDLSELEKLPELIPEGQMYSTTLAGMAHLATAVTICTDKILMLSMPLML